MKKIIKNLNGSGATVSILRERERAMSFRTNYRTRKAFPVYESESDHIRRVLAEEGFSFCPWCYAPILTTDYPAHKAMELAKIEHEKTRAEKYGQGALIDEYEAKR